jgi:Raf kinase inhibitor-like YbhB/YbcL family protein
VRRAELQYLGLAALVVALILAFLFWRSPQRSPNVPPSVKTFLIGKNEIRVSVRGLEYCKTVPVEYTCDAREPVPPTITWNKVNGAKSYAIVVVDPDAPIGPFYHLVVYDITKSSWPPGGVLGTNSAGRLGWFPVCPPRGDKPHRYFFIVLALKDYPNLPPGLSAGELILKIKNDVIAYGYTCGTYARK